MQKYSKLFTKTKKDSPKDETSKNAQLLIRAGYIHKEMAGVYAYLPLGFKVLENIKNIIREEISALGANEIIMTSLQRKELWEITDRWDDKHVDVWFKSELQAGGEVGFGWSHEEPIADMMKNHINSFRDLPVYVHQFQTKLRNELRAKSGIMRGREFVMNDMYSFDTNEENHTNFYNSVIEAYKRIFNRVGIGKNTFVTFASGGAFTKFSHEFQTISNAGEDKIYVCDKKNLAINEEVLNEEVLKDLDIKRKELREEKSIEIGNIFNFSTSKCKQLGLYFKSETDKDIPVWLGSYGIGVTRLMGTIVEIFNDCRGIIWPKSVTPFHVHLVTLGKEHKEQAQNIINSVEKITLKSNKNTSTQKIEVLWDDRNDVSAGEKFADADLIGIPVRVVLSDRSLKNGGVEIKQRNNDKETIVTVDKLVEKITDIYNK